MPASPKTLEVLTIAPESCSSRIGRNARTPWTTPSKLIEISHSSSSGEASATLDASATPALLNTAPIGAGAHCATSAAKASWPWRSRTSSGRTRTAPSSSASVSRRPSSAASAMATGQPCRDRRTASARPMPDAAPVITAVRPASGGREARGTVLESTGRSTMRAMTTRMPPGPPLPKLAQGALGLFAQQWGVELLHRRYGDIFSVTLPAIGRAVVVAHPDLVREVFRADPKVLHAGSQSPLRPVLGKHSLLAIDEDYPLSQRKLLLPPFHGDRMKSYEAIIAEEAEREMAAWPQARPSRTLEPFSRITLNAIIRAVFGAQEQDADDLQRLLPKLVARGSRLALLTFLHRDMGPWSPWAKFLKLRAEFDAVVDRLLARARSDERLEERSDVLALLVQARHDDDTPMHRDEIADELLTLLAAGHETTAATLAWAVERLRRHPAVLSGLVEEIAEGGSDLREATIREVQRVRPTITGAGREAQEPYPLGEWVLPKGTVIMLSARLIHNDPRNYEQPERFDPGRFVGRKPDTYRWIPFGGGMRRCIGAAFAHMEMTVVLRELLSRFELATTTERDERWRFRGVAFAPGRGGRAVVRPRATPLVPVSSPRAEREPARAT